MTPDGKVHYSTGRYFIVSSEDSVSSDGYTTTLRLLKNTDKIKNQFEDSINTNENNIIDTSSNSNNFFNEDSYTLIEGRLNIYQIYARAQCKLRGWGDDQFNALNQLWAKESGWNPKAVNPTSGAYGIPQMNPSGGHADKITAAYKSDYKVQIDTGLDYIANRYSNPVNAWNFWQTNHWY